MPNGPIDYLELTRQALCGVIANALSHVAESGLYGEQHFMLTFNTQHPGVVMPPWLKAKYPNEITIVLQHEYRDLAVMEDRFSVGLSFKERSATLVVPFDAVRTFSDPSVNFALEIPSSEGSSANDTTSSASPIAEALEAVEEAREQAEDEPMANVPDDGGSTVVSLDAFRKK